MPDIAFVNGLWSPLSEAKISIEDRGFQFGDGVYEIIRTYGKAVFGLENHLARLKVSAKELNISIPYTFSEIKQIIQLGCNKSSFKDTLIYIQLTRGVAPRGHAFPRKSRSTLVMTFRETGRISEEVRSRGVSIISMDDIRWGRCNIKSLNLLPNVMAREKANQAGAFEAIFVRDGQVKEGAGSNLFAVFGKKIVTPPLGPFILSGITREIILQIGSSEGLDLSEGILTRHDLSRADEIFLTGTTIEVLPVVQLDGESIGLGRPGKTSRFLYETFLSFVKM